MQPLPVLVLSLAYICLLFAVAWVGERTARRGSPLFESLVVALTMMVCLTAWSFYGSVGRAARHGMDFAAIYLGITLVLLFGRRPIKKMIAIAKEQNITSIADFVAARYGKSRWLAVAMTVSAIIALLPYIALQLKAVGGAFDVLTGGAIESGPMPAPWRDSAAGVTVLLAVFSILFGVRHIHSSQHHRGLMLAIAFESLVKIAAFVIVGIGILAGAPEGLAELASRAPIDTPLAGSGAGFVTNILLAVISFICLPQMFHVMVVENDSPRRINLGAWIFPPYLLLLTFLVPLIAAAGLARFGADLDPDNFVMALPLAAHQPGIALIAYLGGLASATGMVIITAVTLGTMACNDVILPLLLGQRRGDDLSKLLLPIRRCSVTAVLLLAYATHHAIGAHGSLVAIGLTSFVGVVQFGPPALIGLYWQGGNRAGALGGLIAGVAVWIYTLLWPQIDPNAAWIAAGPFGIDWLQPRALFGLAGLKPIVHATLWSLSANIAVYLALSRLMRNRITVIERAQACAFVTSELGNEETEPRAAVSYSIDQLTRIAARFVGPERAADAFAPYRSAKGAESPEPLAFAERFLAGAIGAPSARVVLAAALRGGADQAVLDEASAVIQLNRDLLKTSLENVSQGICVFDRDLRLAAWNHNCRRLLDFPERLMRIGTPFAEWVRFNMERGEYRSEDFPHLLINMDLAHTQWPSFYERTRPDGTVLENCATRLPDGGFVITTTDVTERHRVAAALRQANEKLEERVAERTLALEAAKGEAEKANLDKTRFLASASHDLLQPLNAARLFIAALKEQLDCRWEGFAEDDLQNAATLTDNAAVSLQSVEQLLTVLLDISSLDSGVVRPKIADIRIGELLERLGREFAPMAKAQGLKLKIRKSDALVRSDPQMLRRILQNFVSNALRYTEHGGVLLGCRRRGDILRFEVWDSGPGIPVDKHEEIFVEFRRLKNHRSGERGLGLGLSIVKRMAGLLGHSVCVRSWPGRGSVFAIDLPLGKAEAEQGRRAGVKAESAAVEGLKVLCIDNDPHILAGMRALLSGWGCRVVTAGSLEEALHACDETKPDLLLADFHLEAVLDGLEVIEQIRRHARRQLPAALVTADRSPLVQARAGAIGCDVMYKPVKPAMVRSYIGRVMRAGVGENEAVG